MTQWIAADGTVLTDALVEELADEAEAGFPNSTLTPELSPWRKPPAMAARSLRAPETLWAIIDAQAKAQGVSPSEYTRMALTRGVMATQRDLAA